MKLRLTRLPIRMLVRIVAVMLVAAAIMRAAVEVGDTSSSQSLAAEADTGNPDPLDATLERCRHLAPEQAEDAVCRRAWAENRRRFLGHHVGHAA